MDVSTEEDADYAFRLQLEEAMAASAATTILPCAICLEEVWADNTLCISDCLHRYCLPCMQKHVEFRLLHHSGPPCCPHDGCNTVLQPTEFNKGTLSAKLLHAMTDRLKESEIEEGDRVYCPEPTCSVLMSKLSLNREDQYLESRAACVKCGKDFCLDCKESYGADHCCSEEEKMNPIMNPELKELVNQKNWRRCVNCNHMIELLVGCFHVTCRCGHEFCFKCGASRISRSEAGCSCPLWNEASIVYDPPAT